LPTAQFAHAVVLPVVELHLPARQAVQAVDNTPA